MEREYKRETIMVYDLGHNTKRSVQKSSIYLYESPGNYRIIQAKPDFIIIDNPNILIDDLEMYFNLLSGDPPGLGVNPLGTHEDPPGLGVNPLGTHEDPPGLGVNPLGTHED